MKRVFVLFFGVIVAIAAAAQTTPAKQGPVITWEKSAHDFGTIYQGDVVEYTYKFTNTGTAPLIIANVEVSCGCTTPKGWPRDPVAAGAKGEIVVSFNSQGKMNKQNKTIKVVSNAVNPEGASVTFTADVLAKKPTQ